MKIPLASVLLLGLLGLAPGWAQSGNWTRSRMAQGYYAAMVSNTSGAQFRADCGASDDGKTEIQSVTYLPKGKLRPMDQVQGTIAVDGSSHRYTFQAKQETSAPVEIQLGGEDLDSLEGLKDLVTSIRRGRSLTIEIPTFGTRDTFSLAGAAQALGDCR